MNYSDDRNSVTRVQPAPQENKKKPFSIHVSFWHYLEINYNNHKSIYVLLLRSSTKSIHNEHRTVYRIV